MSDYKVSNTALTAIADAIRSKGGTSENLSFPDGFVSAVQDIPTGGEPTLIEKTITDNGTYDAEDDDADGYSSVTVNVTGTAISGSFTETAGNTYTISFGKTITRYIAYFEMTEASKNMMAQSITSASNKTYGVIAIKWEGCSSFESTTVNFVQRYNGSTTGSSYASNVVNMYNDRIECTLYALSNGANYLYGGYTYNYVIFPLG